MNNNSTIRLVKRSDIDLQKWDAPPDLQRAQPLPVLSVRFSCGYNQDTKLSVMNLDGSGKRVITANFDRAVTNPVWAADGRAVYVLYDDHGSNTSWTQVRVWQAAQEPGGNNIICGKCYIMVNSPALSIGSAFGPLPF